MSFPVDVQQPVSPQTFTSLEISFVCKWHVLIADARNKGQFFPCDEGTTVECSPDVALTWIQVLQKQLFAGLLYKRCFTAIL